jgi:hypothetical protein
MKKEKVKKEEKEEMPRTLDSYFTKNTKNFK